MRRLLTIFATLGLLIGACGSDAEAPQSAAEQTTTPAAEAPAAPTPVTPDPTPTAPPAPSPTAATDERAPVVIDTDMSVEGAMAILYLLEEPTIRVDAITLAGTGLVTCRRGVEQALGLVALAGTEDIPVACGPDTPLGGDNGFPSSFRTTAGSLSGVLLPRGGSASDLAAPELLASVIGSADEPVAVYADGPLTNIALLLESYPETAANISGITIMGGAVDVAGNTFENPDAEWNIWVDPVAADRVFRSGVAITLVPLDATNAVPLTPLHVLHLEQHQTTPVAETTYKLVRGINGLGQGFTYMWDQLNAAVVVDPSVVTMETRSITVVTEGGPDVVGSTVDDPEGAQMHVATDANREAFERIFLSTLLGEPVEPVDLNPDVIATFDGTTWTHDFPESLPFGPIVVGMDNRSDRTAVVVVGWLIGDATLADADAWQSIEQPPFIEVAGFAGADPNTSALSVMELSQPGMNLVIGLTIDPDSVNRIALIDVG